MKILLLIELGLLCSIRLDAQMEGPLNPHTFYNSNIPDYNKQWIDITNVGDPDESYASFGNLTGGVGSHTDYLVVTDFGFQIPAAANIDGIKVEVKCSDPNLRTSDYSVRIVKNGFITNNEKATGTSYPVSNKYITYGSPSDQWNQTWNYKSIDNNNFGVAIAAQRNTNDATDSTATLGRVDNIRITVYYHFITYKLYGNMCKQLGAT
jgi:hypothetical protein